jgi:hypothetical protein
VAGRTEVRSRNVWGDAVDDGGRGGGGQVADGSPPPLRVWGGREVGDVSVDAGFDAQSDAVDAAGGGDIGELVGVVTVIDAAAFAHEETLDADVGLGAEFEEVRPQ